MPRLAVEAPRVSLASFGVRTPSLDDSQSERSVGDLESGPIRPPIGARIATTRSFPPNVRRGTSAGIDFVPGWEAFGRVGRIDTDACHSRGARGTDGEHPQPGSPQTAEGDDGEPGVGLLTRSKRGTRFRTASLVGGTRQRRRLFCSPGVGRDQGVKHCRWRSPDNRKWLNSKRGPNPTFVSPAAR
jgi:hypothetical protein